MQEQDRTMQKSDMKDRSASTRVLLACGVFSAPLFYVVAVAQMLIRDGFEIKTMLIGLLSLGDLVQPKAGPV